MITCPTCKGKGKMRIEATEARGDIVTYSTITCHICEGRQEISEERYKEWQESETMWCRCEKSTFGSYPEDGECDCGIYKHHVHCGTCGKVSQIG